ncbi:MAG: hypothetical protein NW205_05670 [Hyphomicrobiaceae bacterium]|nr:hypothetical protein [Hyphomicrobiaceae bacterium]
MALSVGPARAAVRVCAASVAGAPAVAASEAEAKKAALADWTAKARSADIEHPLWRTAYRKSLTCTGGEPGTFKCSATAMPCEIRQVAPGTSRP